MKKKRTLRGTILALLAAAAFAPLQPAALSDGRRLR